MGKRVWRKSFNDEVLNGFADKNFEALEKNRETLDRQGRLLGRHARNQVASCEKYTLFLIPCLSRCASSNFASARISHSAISSFYALRTTLVAVTDDLRRVYS